MLTALMQGCGSNEKAMLGARRVDLAQWFHEQGFTRGAEIGTWEGAYAEQLCKVVPGVHLTCVDPWFAYDAYKEVKNDQGRLNAAYQKTVSRLAPFNCTILRMTSIEAAQRIPNGSLDFAYIDGNHRAKFVQEDLEAWYPKVRVGGVIAGHDYSNHKRKPFIQVQPVVDEFVATRRIRPLYVLVGDKSASWFWVKP
jgi:hypothetical protein